MFYIYILHSSSADKFYIGCTNNYLRRFEEHNSSDRITYTSKHRPWLIKAVFTCGNNEGTAIRIERFIKQQKSKRLIEKLIDPHFMLEGFLAQLVRVP